MDLDGFKTHPSPAGNIKVRIEGLAAHLKGMEGRCERAYQHGEGEGDIFHYLGHRSFHYCFWITGHASSPLRMKGTSALPWTHFLDSEID